MIGSSRQGFLRQVDAFHEYSSSSDDDEYDGQLSQRKSRQNTDDGESSSDNGSSSDGQEPPPLTKREKLAAAAAYNDSSSDDESSSDDDAEAAVPHNLPALINLYEESSSDDESTDDEAGINQRSIGIKRWGNIPSRDYDSSDDDLSDDDSSEEKKATISPRTVRRRAALPDGYLYDVSKQRDHEPSAPAAVSSRPRVFGPQIRPMPQIDVEQHRHDVLYGTVDILTDVDILFAGLTYGGFDKKRQDRLNHATQMEYFTNFYGVGPLAVEAFFRDLKDKYPSIRYKDALMTMDFLKGYDEGIRLAGRWAYCKDYIREKVKEYVGKFAALKDVKIQFGGFGEADVIIFTVDGVNFNIEEPRNDPSTRWYNHKSHSAGLKYEFALSLSQAAIIWIRGPFPASHHDITVFRGGKTTQKKEDWDRDALYFKMPEGTKCIGDSGYSGEPNKVIVSKNEQSAELKAFLGRAKNRQESLHTRLKSFKVLKDRFRHGRGTESKLNYHKLCVHSVCVIVQYDFENGHPPFEV